MATNDSTEQEKSVAASHSQSPRVPVKHQHSFEERYAAIINQQILKNTINKEALQRQVEAFFPIGGSAARESKKEIKIGHTESGNEDESLDESRKILQKMETLDIKDKEKA